MQSERLPFATSHYSDRYYHRNIEGRNCLRMLIDEDYWGSTWGQVHFAGLLPCEECRPDTMEEGGKS